MLYEVTVRRAIERQLRSNAIARQTGIDSRAMKMLRYVQTGGCMVPVGLVN